MAVTHLFESLVPDGNDETQVRSSDWNAAHVLSNALKAIDGLTPAASKIAYFSGADSAALTDITATGISLLGVADAAAGRTTLELGTVATQAANNVSLTGGSISGMTSISGSTLASTVATGTAPLTITSSTLVTNLNTDTVDGFHASQTPAANQIPVLNSAGRLVLGGSDDGVNALQVNGTIKSTGLKLSGSSFILWGDGQSKISGNAGVLTEYANTFIHYRELSISPYYWFTINFTDGGQIGHLWYGKINQSDTTKFIGTHATVPATRFYANAASDFFWAHAPNNGVGGELTFTNRMSFQADNGVLLLGPTLPTWDGTSQLQVNGPVAAKGLKLDGTASSDVNTLDYYKEGTFTPVLYGLTTAGEGTYTVQTGKYTRIGNTVNITIHLTWTEHTGTGDMRISGLPFASVGHVSLSNWHTSLSVGSGKVLGTYTVDSSSHVLLCAMDPTGAATNIPMDTTGTLIISGTYFA